jgi:hypothetical protein
MFFKGIKMKKIMLQACLFSMFSLGIYCSNKKNPRDQFALVLQEFTQAQQRVEARRVQQEALGGGGGAAVTAAELFDARLNFERERLSRQQDMQQQKRKENMAMERFKIKRAVQNLRNAGIIVAPAQDPESLSAQLVSLSEDAITQEAQVMQVVLDEPAAPKSYFNFFVETCRRARVHVWGK